ncbi:MAG TPA: flippase-like domain-containing protein [Candidatus Hypogeohydataceae bacterium YC41]
MKSLQTEVNTLPLKGLKSLKLIFLLVGIAGFAYLLYSLNASAVYNDLCKLRWKFLIIMIPYAIVFVLDTFGWKYAIKNLTPKLKFSSLFAARMAGESINCLTPSAYLGGEPIKAYLLKTYNISMIDGMASVIISRTIMTLAQVVFVLIGVAMAFSRLNDTGSLWAVAGITLLVGIPVAGMMLASQKKGLCTASLNILRKLGIHIRFLEEKADKLKELDDTIAEFYRTNKKGFYLCFLFYFVGWLAGVIEVYLILKFIGVSIDFTGVFIIEALFTVARSVASFIPGSLGGQEGGVILTFLALSLTAQTAMSFCIIRRIREAIWVGAGLAVLAKWQA